MSPSQEQGRLVGKVALVTGASRGIGKGIAQELASEGAVVYGTGRTAKEGEAPLPGSLPGTIAEIEAAGDIALAAPCDHRDDDAVEQVFQRIEREQGRLDILVNNAFLLPEDVEPRQPFWESPISYWDDMIDVGTRSAYVASRFAAQLMVPRRSGLIVNISSFGARYFHLHIAYGVGKQGLDRVTKDAGRQLAPHGVAMVSLWPYYVKTERLLLAPIGRVDDVEGAESPRFGGRAVVALATDEQVMRYNAMAVSSHQLAIDYGFTDIDGSMPGAPPDPSGG